MSLFVDIFEPIFSNLKISSLTKSVIFGSLRMTVIHTKIFFNSFTYSLINTDDVFWKKRWVCKYLALSTSVEENKNSVKLDFISFWRLTQNTISQLFLNLRHQSILAQHHPFYFVISKRWFSMTLNSRYLLAVLFSLLSRKKNSEHFYKYLVQCQHKTCLQKAILVLGLFRPHGLHFGGPTMFQICNVLLKNPTSELDNPVLFWTHYHHQ